MYLFDEKNTYANDVYFLVNLVEGNLLRGKGKYTEFGKCIQFLSDNTVHTIKYLKII